MGNDMLIKEFKKQIADLPDDLEVYFRRVAPICGNLEIAGVAKLSEVSFFGKAYPCLIIEPTDDTEADNIDLTKN